jgi:hypothetical protein
MPAVGQRRERSWVRTIFWKATTPGKYDSGAEISRKMSMFLKKVAELLKVSDPASSKRLSFRKRPMQEVANWQASRSTEHSDTSSVASILVDATYNSSTSFSRSARFYYIGKPVPSASSWYDNNW